VTSPAHGTARRTSRRGSEKRALIIEATAQLVMELGFSAVGHRAVAERAGVPLSATTYYFRSLDDLLTATVERLAGTWLTAAREAVDRFAGPGELPDVADAVLATALLTPTGSGSADRAGVLSLYDRYLEAARHPHLQVLIATYDRDLDHLISTVLSRAGLPHDLDAAALVLAVADGAVLRALAEGSDVGAARHSVERVLEHMSAATVVRPSARIG
jgi:DNA-binding transcriptional regulator YbjK